MNTKQPQQDQRDEHQRNEHRQDGISEKLERALRTVDPPGQEVSNDELRDPGRAIPSRGPTDNRS